MPKIFHKIFSIVGLLFILLTPLIVIKSDAVTSLGYIGIFLYNCVASGLLLIPILSTKFNPLGLVLVSAGGNIVNTSINYLIGYNSSSLFNSNRVVVNLKKLVKRFGLIGVFILAMVPLPFDAGGLLSGYLGIPYKKYILVNFLGKCTIFLLECLIVLWF